MVNIAAILVTNSSAVVLLLILMLSSKRTIQNRLPDNVLFYIMVISAILQCIFETSTFLLDGKMNPGFHTLILIVNSLTYINNIVFALIWTMYADYKLFSDLDHMKKNSIFLSIPAVLVIVFSIVNLFVPVFFSVSAENVYQRTELYIIPFAVTYFYLFYGVIYIYRNRKKGNRYLFMPAIIFMIPIILGSVAQLLFYGISTVWIGTAISLASMYINVQNEISFTDSLSGVFNRQYMNNFLDSEVRRSGQKGILGGIMLDIDRFKSINDQFGHLVGDDAIRSAGMILRSCVSAPGIVARFAGDEFVVILWANNQTEILRLMKRIGDATDRFNQSAKKPYTLHFSMGYSVYNHSSDTADSFINRIDSSMYDDKNKGKLNTK